MSRMGQKGWGMKQEVHLEPSTSPLQRQGQGLVPVLMKGQKNCMEAGVGDWQIDWGEDLAFRSIVMRTECWSRTWNSVRGMGKKD